MALQLLETKESVQAAVATVNPVVREAALLLAHRIFQDPTLATNGEAAFQECVQSCSQSLERAGIDIQLHADVLDAFLMEHGHAVMNVGFSIVYVAAKEQQRQAVWGVVGKVAAAAIGLAVGVWAG